jgi:cystathionine beta-lyase/cystathionine gamma-synthase
MKWGAHLVVHSTKLMDGQDVLGGVTVGDPELIKKNIYFPDLRDPHYPFNAWVLSKV